MTINQGIDTAMTATERLKMHLARNEKRFLGILVLPQITLMVVSIIIFFAGYETLAWGISSLGLLLYLLGVVLWVVLIDSRRRLPGTTAPRRLGKLFSFER